MSWNKKRGARHGSVKQSLRDIHCATEADQRSFPEEQSFGEATLKIVIAAVAACLLGALAQSSPVQAFQSEETLRIGGLWAITGGVALTGKGALNLSRLAVEEINSAGGVRVGGKQVKLELIAYDEACKPEEGLALADRLANVDKVLFSLGPTCSGTAEPIFNTLQKRLDDQNDKGAQFLFFTDTASKFGLAKISPWVFRNTVDEPAMYSLVMKHLTEKMPELKTVSVAWEPDFAHSSSTWKLIIKPLIEKDENHKIVEVVEWGWQATDYSQQVAKLAKANADIYVTLTHEPTTCASFKEMHKQGVKPKIIIAISSLAGGTVIVGCPDLAEGMVVPTNFAPVTPKAVELEKKAWDRFKAEANLDRSHTAYEIIYLVKRLIEGLDIQNTPESLLSDRRKLRDALAKVTSFEGMIGPIKINPESDPQKPREAEKELFLLQVKAGQWTVLHSPPSFRKP
jgi:branched-chain amino acid transport system substrate-binding protein